MTAHRTEVVRLSVNLAPDVAEQVKALAADAGLTITDITRRAFGLLALVREAQRDGYRIIATQPGRPDRTLHILEAGQ